MTDRNVAYQHLLNCVLTEHAKRRNLDKDLVEDDFFEFTEEELKRIVDALWADRYSPDRKTFKTIVGQIISEKVAEE